MKWKKYTIETTVEGEDLICAMLSGLGIDAVELEDHAPVSGEKEGGVFAELQPDPEPDDGAARVIFYLEDDMPEDAAEGLVAQIAEELARMRAYADLGSGRITRGKTEQQDWADNWKQFFTAFDVDGVYIKPTWEKAVGGRPDRILIEIDPGMAFGTGKHESTQLCIRQLRKYLRPGNRVLDVGCGSGILSILACKLGAAYVAGTDIDEDCIAATRENLERNGVASEGGDFFCGNLITDVSLQKRLQTKDYDVVVANILADIIIPMIPAVTLCMKPGALFITSGIIDFKEKAVADALTAEGLRILETNRQGEWVNITAQKD